MNTPVYCTNNTLWIGHNSYLYLPHSWCLGPKTRNDKLTILDTTMQYRGLYIIAHGHLWNDGKSIWRIVHHQSRTPTAFYLNSDTRLWHDSVSRSPLRAEKVSYDELRLEAIFLLG
jgi:hypothetical protein